MPLTLPLTVALNLPNTGFALAAIAGEASRPSASAPAARVTAILVHLIPVSLAGSRGPGCDLRTAVGLPDRCAPPPLRSHAQDTKDQGADPPVRRMAAHPSRRADPGCPFGPTRAYPGRGETSPLRRALGRLTRRRPMLGSLSNHGHRQGDGGRSSRGGELSRTALAMPSSQERDNANLARTPAKGIGASRPR